MNLFLISLNIAWTEFMNLQLITAKIVDSFINAVTYLLILNFG